MSSTSELNLGCWLVSDDINLDHFISVHVPRSETTHKLRHAIKAEYPVRLENIEATSLELWKVSIPFHEDMHPILEGLVQRKIPDGSKLYPLTPLSSVFPTQPPPNILSIIAYAPTVDASVHARGEKLPLLALSAQELREVRWSFWEKLSKISPSQLTQPSELHALQGGTNFIVQCNRPPSAAIMVPVTLLHPIFGQFSDDCYSHVPSKEDNALAFELSTAMSEYFPDERHRAQRLRQILQCHGIPVAATTINGTEFTTDGDLQHLGHRYTIIELRLEVVGSNGAEPYMQAALCHFHSTKSAVDNDPTFNFPCLIVTLFGPHISFSGAVWHVYPDNQVLSHALTLCWHHTDTRMRESGARHFGAFKKAILSLQKYYEEYAAGSPSSVSLQPQFPFQRLFTCIKNGTKHNFSYISQLDSKKLLFIAKTEDGEMLCLKFVHTYSKEAHMICASMDFAPPLKGFDTLPGDWHMVVMDLIGDTQSSFNGVRASAHTREVFNEKLKALHSAGFVHGDVRDVNIMVSTSGEPLLLDFDWSGKIGEVRYPMNVNKNRHLWRPDGAYDGQLITCEHDLQMMDRMFEGAMDVDK